MLVAVSSRGGDGYFQSVEGGRERMRGREREDGRGRGEDTREGKRAYGGGKR